MDDHELQLQIPDFVYNIGPTLVPGGGAEVVPVGNASWFLHNGFTPTLIDHPFFASQQSPPHEDSEQHNDSSSGPFDFSIPPSQSYDPSPCPLPTPDLSVFLADPPSSRVVPSPLGLPIYSASGFDLLSILARVSTRPYPRVVLGPVDLTCSFVVVDVRRYDHPIVYCSETFCKLTGYSEAEVLGRNCRFLQAPGGIVSKGEPRANTSQDAVNHLRKSLMADKECQTSILNYKKNGAPFINLVTVIPIPGTVAPDDNEIAYQVGFQVDLTEQPNAILEKLRDGSYIVDYAGQSDLAPFGHGIHRRIQSIGPHQSMQSANARDRKTNAIPPVVMSKELKCLLADPMFMRSLTISSSVTSPPTTSSSLSLAEDTLAAGANHPLHMLLLEASPDFIHVVSLKGDFLYVAPSVRRVLGYDSDEMIGTSIANYAHPEDVIPLMRELKESSATGPTSTNTGDANTFSAQLGMPRNVDILFRAKTKMGRYVWVECRGRLHVEPGKGRKAIVLSGRAREMMNLKWEDVKRAGGLARGLRVLQKDDGATREKPTYKLVEQEAWGLLGGSCKETATFLSVGKGMEDVLGWTTDDLMGRSLMDIVFDESARNILGGFIVAMRYYQQQQRLAPHQRGLADGSTLKKIGCQLRRKDGSVADVWFIVYRADPDVAEEQNPLNEAKGAGSSISPAALVYQIRLVNAETIVGGSDAHVVQALAMSQRASTSSMKSSSSLAGAASLPNASTLPSSSSSAASSSSSSPSAVVDMFEELSVSRGSSWQYELQQLRITNLRLQEELAELEAADATAASLQSQNQPALQPIQSGYDIAYDSLEYADGPQHQLYPVPPPPPPPHLELHRGYPPQHHQLHFDHPQPQPQSHAQPQAQQLVVQNPSYLHHPQPLTQYTASLEKMRFPLAMPGSDQHPHLKRGQPAAHPRLSIGQKTTPLAWGTMSPSAPGFTSAYAPAAGPSRKRAWGEINAA